MAHLGVCAAVGQLLAENEQPMQDPIWLEDFFNDITKACSQKCKHLKSKCFFSPTYLFEQTFSVMNMNNNQSHLRSGTYGTFCAAIPLPSVRKAELLCGDLFTA